MRLEKASAKSIKFACVNYHYSKCHPPNAFGYSVFNDNGEYCGVVLFGVGANNNLGKPFGLNNGQCAELVRMALNGKQECTSKVLSLARKVFKKDNPLCRLIISFADTEQNHKGTIYQADNWTYIGDTIAADEYLYKNKRWHGRAFRSQFGSHKNYIEKGLETIKGSVKYRYAYPIDKSLISILKDMSKPYPKKQITSV